jgi:tetratricopeptide (TPR) repeat protein
VAAADAGDWAQAVSLSTDAVRADPDLTAYHFQLGVAAANAGNLELAAASLTKCATADDYPYAWLNLAAVRWKLGDAAGAKEALDRAERLGLQRVPIAVAAGWLRQQFGDTDAAIERYAGAVRLAPTLADDPFWRSSDAPPGGIEPILERAVETASPETGFLIAMILGRFDRAQDAIVRRTVSDPELFKTILAAWQGNTAESERLQATAADRPLDITVVSWARLVASHRGDLAAVDRYGTWLSILGSFEGGAPPIARIVLDAPYPLPATLLDRYGSLYRRRVPAGQVVGILPQVVLKNEP